MKKYATGFSRWLLKQKDRNDPVGDLAVDADYDNDWPHKAESFWKFLDYLRGCNACQGAIDALERAWKEFYEFLFPSMDRIEEALDNLSDDRVTLLEYGDDFQTNSKYYVYALLDPTDYDSVRYIGVTKDPAKRLKDHVVNPGSVDKLLWTADILRAGKYPIMAILDQDKDRKMAGELEKAFIVELDWRGSLFNRNLTKKIE